MKISDQLCEIKWNSTGNYSCFAENELGKSRGFIELSGDDFNHDDSDSDSDWDEKDKETFGVQTS